MTETTPRPDGHVNHGGPILDRHDYRDWVEWPENRDIPLGTRVRQEYVSGRYQQTVQYYVHPDDVPTDPDAGLVERVARVLFDRDADATGAPDKHFDLPVVRDAYRASARNALAVIRAHDKADR
jgi:hypothetical protein